MRVYFLPNRFKVPFNNVHTSAPLAGESLFLVVEKRFDNHLPEVHVAVPWAFRVVTVNRPANVNLAGLH